MRAAHRHVVPFTKIQEQLRLHCPEALFTLLMRRFMMRIAEAIARKANAGAWSPASPWAKWPARPWLALGSPRM